METVYLKKNNLYEVRLTVFLVYVEYVGYGQCPFICNIISTDDKHFCCAATPGNAAEFFLVQQGDNLVLQLEPPAKSPLVMRLVSYQNLSHKWRNFALQKLPDDPLNIFSITLEIQDIYVLPTAYVRNGSVPVSQDVSYCVIKDTQGCFIVVSAASRFLCDILGSHHGDRIQLYFYSHDNFDDIFILHKYFNTSRKIQRISKAVRNL